MRWNPYQYVGSNPVNRTDPSGKFFWFVLGAIADFEGGFAYDLLVHGKSRQAAFRDNLVSGVVAVSTTQGWLLVLYLGLVPTALAYWLFQVGLRTVSATTASIVSMLDPLVAALLAWMLFSETLPTTSVMGAMLLLISIILLTTGKRT